ncbi:hypothetical protein RQP46_003987 [Phenoliferia psychrophenolica]
MRHYHRPGDSSRRSIYAWNFIASWKERWPHPTSILAEAATQAGRCLAQYIRHASAYMAISTAGFWTPMRPVVSLVMILPSPSDLAQWSWAHPSERKINISYAYVNPDGLFKGKKAVGVNGTWPPPPLEVAVGDTVRVHAYNGLGDQNVGLHHHGIYFNTTSHFDGAPGINMTYEIPVDEQHGTYWWHSHVGGQYVDGLRAPFIVHPAVEQHQYDHDLTVVLGDWYHQEHAVLVKDFMSVDNPDGAEPIPQSALVYWVKDGKYLPGFNENVTVPFEAGKTYRLRIINTSSYAMFYVWLDGHDFRIIEVDGTDTDEYAIDQLSLSAAQRYSVLVTARNDTDLNYAFHADLDFAMFDSFPEDLQQNYTSVISYGQSNALAPLEVKDEYQLVPDQKLVPSVIEQQLFATKKIELGFVFETFDDGTNRGSFNNLTFQMPITPSLYSASMLSMGEDATNIAVYGKQSAAYILEKNEVVDLLVINWDDNAHPFHMHGHKFQIIRVAQDVSSSDPVLNPPHTEGAANPMRRDTVTIPAGGAYNIRFIADNPGAWLFHCHIEWHFEAGLSILFIEDPLGAQKNTHVPQYMLDQCTAQGISPTGNVVGRNSTTDLRGEPSGPFPPRSSERSWRPLAMSALAWLAALLGMGAAGAWYIFGVKKSYEVVLVEEERDPLLKKVTRAAPEERDVEQGLPGRKS